MKKIMININNVRELKMVSKRLDVIGFHWTFEKAFPVPDFVPNTEPIYLYCEKNKRLLWDHAYVDTTGYRDEYFQIEADDFMKSPINYALKGAQKK